MLIRLPYERCRRRLTLRPQTEGQNWIWQSTSNCLSTMEHAILTPSNCLENQKELLAKCALKKNLNITPDGADGLLLRGRGREGVLPAGFRGWIWDKIQAKCESTTTLVCNPCKSSLQPPQIVTNTAQYCSRPWKELKRLATARRGDEFKGTRNHMGYRSEKMIPVPARPSDLNCKQTILDPGLLKLLAV